MDHLPGHERREERRHGRRERRRVHFGELFNSDELAAGDVELEEVPPAQEEYEEATEPWAWRDKPMPGSVRQRLRGYQDFLREWRESHPDEPTGDEPGEPVEEEVT